MTDGMLVLVATPIGNLGDVSARALDALRDADVIAAEDPSHTRKLLSAFDIAGGSRLRAVHQHNERQAAEWVVDAVRAGKTVAYVTDAGTPGISDPGGALVRAVVDAGLEVTAVPGPSALVDALVLSALPTDRFRFEGFLPRKGPERKARLAAIAASDATSVLYESPLRIATTVADLAGECGADRRVALCRELTKRFEEVRRGTLGVFAASDLKTLGEYVVVVAPSPPIDALVDDDVVVAALVEELRSGASARDAAATVAQELGIPKRRAYNLVITLSREV